MSDSDTSQEPGAKHPATGENLPQDTIEPTGQQSGPWRSALMGAILGLDAASLCLALATICFGGQLAAGLGLATGLFLLGSVVATQILYHFGGFRLPLAISQDTTIAILAPAVVLAASAVTGPVEAKVATALAVIGVSAIASGLVFLIIGCLGLGRLIRMFPYPVAAGFLASSGYLLVFSAASLLTGQTGLAAMAKAAGEPLVQLRLFPALAMALAMFLAMRFWKGAAPVLVVVFAFLAAYYILAYGFGINSTAAVALGLLPRMGAVTSGQFGFELLGLIDWTAVWRAAPVIMAVVLLNLIGMLLNTSGVEMATREDVDENRELRVTGAANLLIGAFGGLMSYLQSGATIMSAKLRVQPRAMIAGHNAALLVACGFASVIVAAVPTFVPAALLMFIGLSMLADWLVGTRHRLIGADWLIVLSIVVTTALIGILAAIGIGIALALVGFAHASIRLPIIRHKTTTAKRRSIRDRSRLHGEVLRNEGHRICILHLDGPLFFGSVEKMTAKLRGYIRSDTTIQSVIFDFTDVKSFDSSACAALDKLVHIMATQGIAAHITGVSAGLFAVLKKWGLPLANSSERQPVPAFHHWPSLDEALEHCETALLAGLGHGEEKEDIARMLLELGRHHPRSLDLLALMEVQNLAAGETLIEASQLSGDVYFLTSGWLSVHLPTKTGQSVRVRSMGPGTIVGEIAYLTGQPRNAHVISEGESEVLCLPEATLRRIDATDRDLAALVLAIFGRSLATKLAQSNEILTHAQFAAATNTE